MPEIRREVLILPGVTRDHSFRIPPVKPGRLFPDAPLA